MGVLVIHGMAKGINQGITPILQIFLCHVAKSTYLRILN